MVAGSDNIYIVADTTFHRIDADATVQVVVTEAAVQHVVADQAVKIVRVLVANNDVIEFVAGTADDRRDGNLVSEGQGQVLDIGVKSIPDIGVDRVEALSRRLDDQIAHQTREVVRLLDVVGVIPCTANERIDATVAIEDIIRRIVGDLVVKRISPDLGIRIVGTE